MWRYCAYPSHLIPRWDLMALVIGTSVRQQRSPYLIPVEASGTVYQLSVRARIMADRLLDNTLYAEVAPQFPFDNYPIIEQFLNILSTFTHHSALSSPAEPSPLPGKGKGDSGFVRSLSWDSDSQAGSEEISSEADTDDESPSRTVLSQHPPPFAPDYFMGGWGYNREEHQDMSLNAPAPKVETFSMGSMFWTSISPKVSDTALSYQSRDTSTRIVNPITSIQQQGRRAPKAAFSWHHVYQNGNLTVTASFFRRYREWSSSNDISVTVDAFARNTSQSVASRHFGKRRGGALSRNWSDDRLWGPPPPHLYRRTVTKILWEGCKGFMVLPTLKQHK